MEQLRKHLSLRAVFCCLFIIALLGSPFAGESQTYPPGARETGSAVPGDSRGTLNPRTGEVYPSVPGGALNPRTGEVYPVVPGGVLNPRTGEVYPRAGSALISPRPGGPGPEPAPGPSPQPVPSPLLPTQPGSRQ